MAACVQCAAKIPADARLCAHCGSHQSNWRNEVLFVSTLVGIASLTVTAVAFLISIWPDVTAVVAWQDRIEVVEFDALDPIVVANRGDGPVYVSDFRTTTEWGSSRRSVNVVIEPGAVSVLAPDSVNDATYDGYRSTSTIPHPDSTGHYRDSDRCNVALVMSASSPVYRLWSAAMGESFVTFDEPAEVVVRYHGIESGVNHEDTLAMPAVPASRPDCLPGPGLSN